MTEFDLDEVDRTILHLLQEDARTATAEEMGEAADVSAPTVRNRIEKIEAQGVIRGYPPDIDYEEAGYQLYLFIICKAPPAERAALAEEALDITGTINVREMLSGANNLHIEAIAENSDAVDIIAGKVDDLDHVAIESVEIAKKNHQQPFDHFGLAPSTGEAER